VAAGVPPNKGVLKQAAGMMITGKENEATMKPIRKKSPFDRFNVMANTIGSHLEGLLDWLYGCSHRRTSFPMMLRVTVNGQQSRRSETYIVCVECGRRFAYDWATMRITKRPAAQAANGQFFEAGARTSTPCPAGRGVQLIGTP
jgi:hypothetical protein